MPILEWLADRILSREDAEAALYDLAEIAARDRGWAASLKQNARLARLLVYHIVWRLTQRPFRPKLVGIAMMPFIPLKERVVFLVQFILVVIVMISILKILSDMIKEMRERSAREAVAIV